MDFSHTYPSVRGSAKELHGMLHPERRIYEHLTVQLKLKIPTVYMAPNPMRRLPPSDGLLRSVPNVRWKPGHFVKTTTALKPPTVAEVNDHHLESAVQDVVFVLA